MTLRELASVFMIEHANMKIVHWKVRGHSFDSLHEACDEYAKMIRKDLDYIVESGLRTNINPPSYKEAMEISKSYCKILKSDKDFDSDIAVKLIDNILGSIITSIKEALEDDVVDKDEGIESELESMMDKYEKEKNFINKRRGD